MTGYAAMFLFTTILAEKLNRTNNLPLDSSALRHRTPEKPAPLAQHGRKLTHKAQLNNAQALNVFEGKMMRFPIRLQPIRDDPSVLSYT